MPDISVFGAEGFLGRHLCKRLLQAGASVHGYDVMETPSIAHDCYQYHRLDVLRDAVTLPASCSSVVYLSQSAEYRLFPQRMENLFGVNAWGPARVAEAFLKTGGTLFLFASTGNVYAPSFAPLDELSPLCRDNAYSLSKLASEDMMHLLNSQISGRRFASLRFFGLFGPGQRSMLPVTLFKSVWNDQPITLQPSVHDSNDHGGLRVSWLYIHDLTSILQSILMGDIPSETLPPCMNIAGPAPRGLREFAETIARHLGRQARWNVVDQPRQFDLAADISRLRRLCNPSFTSFDEAVAETVRELSAHMQGRP
jgi:UDP-glucose 4-epimerase